MIIELLYYCPYDLVCCCDKRYLLVHFEGYKECVGAKLTSDAVFSLFDHHKMPQMATEDAHRPSDI